MCEILRGKHMKVLEYFSKVVELITPEYARKIHQKRCERLKNFFEERQLILESSLSEREKNIQLNAAVSALTGASFSNIEEFNFFLEHFDPNNFENDYLAFARNRITYEIVDNEHGSKIIKSISKQFWLMHFLHFFMLSMFLLVPLALLINFHAYIKALKVDLNVPESITSLGIWIAILICFLTLIKIFYEWACWNDFNKLIKKKYR